MLASASVLVVAPRGAPRRVALGTAVTVIGSAADATIILAEEGVAGEHALIRREGAGFVLVRRAQPVLLNGKPVRQARLASGDLIGIGRCALAFSFGATPVDAAAAVDPAEVCRRLTDFSRRLQAGDAPEAVSEQLLADVVALTRAERGQLVLAGGADEPLVRPAVIGADEPALSRTALARVRDTGQPARWSDAALDADLAGAPSVAGHGVRSLLAAPIFDGERVAGALLVAHRLPARFDDEAAALLGLYAGLAASLLRAAERARALGGRVAEVEERLAALQSQVLIGSSAPMRKLAEEVRKVAAFDLSVLLRGETGTGKEVVARELHRQGARAAGPFQAVHCGALPETLLEAELFGHRRGAFTGAVADRVGLIRAADGGTLFLDEIGEMPLAQQTRLLRVLEDRRVQPIGDNRSYAVDFRLVAATHRPLEEMVESGGFRRDLYFRMAGVVVHIPPLRERGDDVVELAHHFLHRYGAGRDLHLSSAALAALRAHRFPGNVRELEAGVKRALALCDGPRIDPEHLGLAPAAAPAAPPPSDEILPLTVVRDRYLAGYVRDVVERFGGNQTAAAEAMGVTPRTVFKYLNDV